MGPVIEAIEAGHFIDSQKDRGNCRACSAGRGDQDRVAWVECPVLKAARAEQLVYAERLRGRTDRDAFKTTMVETRR